MAAMQDVRTLIFLDVDGVLNIGIRDEDNAPLLFRDEDVRMAQKLSKQGYRGPEAKCVAKLNALASHPLCHGEEGCFDKLMTQNGGEISEVLVSRLAELIRFAGDGTKVVLSSSWRRPHHRNRRRLLEQAIARHLERPFLFTEQTPMYREERHARDRLRTIGDYISNFCSKRQKASDLRMLVIEDFFISAMDGWLCGGEVIDSVSAAESYLEAQADSSGSVKLFHCYEEVTTSSGMRLQVGSGFSEKLLAEAKQFISESCSRGSDGSSQTLSQPEGDETPPFPGHPPVPPSAKEEQELNFMQLLSAFVPVSSVISAF
eukprot:TRINITY_DN60782_c0_g1_i1.p1 TRINITY_DN60782_c0_g1~~TRINITY_DN60782_c0_g1_i1.p1  ORF type:complete len:317 (+),score=72.25 TRINITY_DN60782_c0_g1_i1:58-1008(+)